MISRQYLRRRRRNIAAISPSETARNRWQGQRQPAGQSLGAFFTQRGPAWPVIGVLPGRQKSGGDCTTSAPARGASASAFASACADSARLASSSSTAARFIHAFA
mgnify:CR=1 FL=1